MRNKGCLIFSIWFIVVLLLLIFYMERGEAVVKDFTSWAISVWPILVVVASGGITLTGLIIRHDFNEQNKERLRERLYKAQSVATELVRLATNAKMSVFSNELASVVSADDKFKDAIHSIEKATWKKQAKIKAEALIGSLHKERGILDACKRASNITQLKPDLDKHAEKIVLQIEDLIKEI
jgi:hypothetical protein